MSYVVRAYFRAGVGKSRLKIRPDHIRYVISALPGVVCAGALCGEDQLPRGLFLVLDCAEKTEADAFIANEPYNRAGLLERVEVERLIQFAPHPNPRILHEELERAMEAASRATAG
ncbi:hypothetical protein LMG23992_00793 [Cupriavidus laharis]|uniref:YCII-related domain-containing protein n=1 Tax=Cupriavidus laharis TaxID=151654 RepID=A0ABN7Y221_9BURK|nr:YciI family protein [Cupriavidus laharis]CAG9167372.1 hypothetical protein LMG23992_00793 [Cupriavidus laharis]